MEEDVDLTKLEQEGEEIEAAITMAHTLMNFNAERRARIIKRVQQVFVCKDVIATGS